MIKQRLELDLSGYEANIKKAKRLARELAKESEGAATKSARAAERAWDRAGTRIERTMNRLKGLIATVFATAVVSRFGQAMIQASADMENLEASFTTLLGSAEAARRKLAEIQALAERNPLVFTELAGSARMLLATGTAADELVPKLEAIADAAAAVAPGEMGVAIERMIRQLSQMQAKGKVMSEDMRVFAEVGIPAWELMAEGMGKTTRELIDLSAKGALPAKEALEGLFHAMEGRYQGAGMRMAGTFSGIVGRIKDAAQQVMRSIGSGLFDALKGDLEGLLRRFEEARADGSLKAWMRQISDAFATAYNAAKRIGQALYEWGPAILEVAGLIVTFQIIAATVTKIDGMMARIGKGVRNFGVQLTRNEEALRKQKEAVEAIIRGAERFRGYDTPDAAAGWTRMIKQHEAQLHKLEGRITKLRRAGERYTRNAETGFGRARNAARAFAAQIFSLQTAISLGVTAIIAAAFWVYRWATRTDELTKKLRAQREEMVRVRSELDKLSGSAAAQQRLEIEIEVSINQARLRQAEQELADLEARQEKNRPLFGFGGDQARIMELRAHIIEYKKTLEEQQRTLPAVTAAAQQSIMGEIRYREMQIERIQDTIALTEAEKEQLEALNRERQKAVDNPALSAAQLATELARIDAQIRAVTSKKLTAEAQAEVERLTREIEDLQRRARERGLLPAETTTTPDPGSTDTGRAERIRDLMRELELVERLNGLKGVALSRQEEINALERELYDLADQRAEFASDPALAAALQTRIDALEAEKAALQAQMPMYQRVQGHYDALDASARSLVDQAGGIDGLMQAFERSVGPERAADLMEYTLEVLKQLPREAHAFIEQMGGLSELAASGYTPAMLETLLVPLSELDTYAKALSEKLAEIQQNQDLHLITPEQARRDAETAAEEFRAHLVRLLSSGAFEGLPGPFRQFVDGIVQGMASQIGSSTRTDADKVADGNREAADAFEKQAAALERSAEAMNRYVQAGRGLTQIALSVGKVSDGFASMASGIFDALEGLVEMKRVQSEIARINAQRTADGLSPLSQGAQALMGVGAFAGIAGGLFSAASGIVDALNARSDEAQRQAEQQREEMRRIGDALRSYQQQIRQSIESLFGGGRTGSGLRQSQIDAARTITEQIADFMSGIGGRSGRPGRGGTGSSYSPQERDAAREMLAELDALGIFDVDLVGLFDTLMERHGGNLQQVMQQILAGDRGRGGDFEGITAILERLAGGLSDFTDDLSGAVDAVSFFARFMGEDAAAQLRRFMDALLDEGTELFSKLDSDLVAKLAEARGLDLTTEAGRKALQQIIEAIAGDFSAFQGDLTAEELERLLAELERMNRDAASGAGETEWSRSVQWMRTITEVQAHEMVVLLTEISYYLRKLYEAAVLPQVHVPTLPSSMGTSSLSATGTSVRIGDVNISVSGGSDWAKEAGRELERKLQRKKLRAL